MLPSARRHAALKARRGVFPLEMSKLQARHEVPGIMRKIARPSGTIERISAQIPSDPNFQQEYLAFLKRHQLSFDDKYL